MSDSIQSPSVLVISNDAEVVEAIVGNNTSDHTFHARETVRLALDEPELFENNSIIIFDIATTDNDVDESINQAIQLKQADPTQVLMVVGDKEPLSDILKSNIQPMVYRAFNKPISPNQIFLAFKSANALHQELIEKKAAGEDILVIGPKENRANVDAMADERKTNPAIYAGMGILALGILGWLLFGGGDDDVQPVVVDSTPAPQIESAIEADQSAAISRTNDLNQLAANAMLDGRYVTPKGDNALEYYDQVLIIDPYDSTAYEGRKNVALVLRESYAGLVEKAEFDNALSVVNALKLIEPLNLENDKLQADLEKSITAHVKEVRKSGDVKDIEKTSAVLAKIESVSESSKSASDALKAEQVLITKIDAALKNNNLIPPAKGNAYSLVSDALKGNKISKANSEPRVKDLSTKLLALANTKLAEDDLEETTKLGALVKRLNVDRQGLASLDNALTARKNEIAEAEAAANQEPEPEVAVEEAKPAPPKIIPAKIISREPPRYPGRALKGSIEGWVEVKFKINPQGEPFNVEVKSAQPEGMFESAAVKSVRKWRFSPARNQETGLPVESTTISTKVQFKLG